MLVPDCTALSLLFIDSCEEKSKLYMDSQPQEGAFNIEPCWACGEKRRSHTEADAEKRCKHKTQPSPLAVLWKILNRSTHIKRKNCFTPCKEARSLKAKRSVESKANFVVAIFISPAFELGFHAS
jgi:hypothetical protein